MIDNSILTINDIQKYLKISRSKAYDLIKSPDFPIIRIGKCIRVNENELDNWLHNYKKNDIFA